MNDIDVEKLKKDFWEKIRPPRTFAEMIAERAAEYIDEQIVKQFNKNKELIKENHPKMSDEEIEELLTKIYEQR